VAKSKKNSTVAAAAAAAAAAAVRATHDEEESGVRLKWATDEDDDDDGEVSDEILQGLAQIDEQAGGEIVWWELYCDSPIDKAGQIRKLSTSEIKGVRDECLQLGPGEYHVIARHKKGTFIKGSRLRIKISGFARPAAAPASTPAAATDPMLIMQRWDERMEQRRLAAKAERDQQIRFWAPILAPIGAELAKGLLGGRGGESIKDLVAALVSMKELSGKSESSLDALLKGIELARDLAPDAKGSTWPDVLVSGITQVTKELRPLAETLVNRRNATPTATQNGAPAQLQFAPAQPAAGGNAAAASANTTTAAAEGDPMWAIIAPLLTRLAGELEEFAVNGTDPGLAAEALLAKVPRLIKNQVQPQQLKEWLTQADWWQRTIQFHPGLASHQGFCDDVRLSLVDIVEQELNPKAAPDDESTED
jgi:hypothetical protein